MASDKTIPRAFRIHRILFLKPNVRDLFFFQNYTLALNIISSFLFFNLVSFILLHSVLWISIHLSLIPKYYQICINLPIISEK